MDIIKVKANSFEIVKILSWGVLLWSKGPIKLNPEVRNGDGANKISVYINTPAYNKGFTKIRINYDWIYENNGSDLQFVLSDSRRFGWSCGSRHFPLKYGSDDGISGSPKSEIEIHRVDEPISSIKLDITFKRRISYSDIRNIGVSAEYYIGE